MGFAVTFLDMTTLNVFILKRVASFSEAQAALNAIAKAYILQKDGERNMKIVTENELDKRPVDIGHFLCEISKTCYDLYRRDRKVSVGYLYNTSKYQIIRVGRYQISEDTSENIDDAMSASVLEDFTSVDVPRMKKTSVNKVAAFDAVLDEFRSKHCQKNVGDV